MNCFTIKEKISDTAKDQGFLHYRSFKKTHLHNDFINQLFVEVERVNIHFLGGSTKYQMTMEMTQSICYESCLHEFDDGDDSDDNEDFNPREQTDDKEDINSNGQRDNMDFINCE
ncbi:hypothetical protein BGX20_006891, partial [Mortierella sp. AD010]